MQIHVIRRDKQSGAFIVTVCLMLFFLLAFIGIALDFGRLFIVKAELQTATDACALAAAQELDRQPNALLRATNAGLAAGNANGVVMQSALWEGKGQLNAAHLSFRDEAHNVTTADAQARYARCAYTQPAIATPLLGMLAMLGNSGNTVATADVFARAEATLAPSQSTCPLPLAIRPRAGSGKPDYGYTRGEWITMLMAPSSGKPADLPPGEIGWVTLDGSNDANNLGKQLKGYCGTRVGDDLGTPGVNASVTDVWNARFGIYKNGDGPAHSQPDFTGYVYTAKNWTQQKDAFDDFMAQRSTFTNCGALVADCEKASGLKLNAKDVASAGINGDLRKYGGNRRIAPVPIIANGKVSDYACVLMLQPLSTPFANVQLEYLGNASEADSPCVASGLPGGSAGPLVPVLVL